MLQNSNISWRLILTIFLKVLYNEFIVLQSMTSEHYRVDELILCFMM
jgi:hypothetical protein